MQQQLRALKESILLDPSAAAAGIEESLFVDERKLHLTLVMLKLYTEERRQQAARVSRTLSYFPWEELSQIRSSEFWRVASRG